MTECFSEPKISFYQEKRIEIKFSEQQLSTDAGILLVRQAEEKVKIIAGMSERIADERDPNKITHLTRMSKKASGNATQQMPASAPEGTTSI
jgi:hypothetical protein